MHAHGSNVIVFFVALASHNVDRITNFACGGEWGIIFPNHPPFSDVLYGRVPAIASWPLYFMSMRGYGAYLPLLVGILPEIQNL